MFQLALIAKEIINIDNPINLSVQDIATTATIAEAPDSENNQDNPARLARNLEENGRYEDKQKQKSD